MDLAVLDPDMLVISESDWLNEVSRDGFLSHFLDVISCIDEVGDLFLAWSDLIEEFIWTIHEPPWKKDTLWSNTLVPIIYAKISKNKFIVELTSSEVCSLRPCLNCLNVDLYNIFLHMLGSLFDACDSLLVCLSLKNRTLENFDFNICGVDFIPRPIVVRNKIDFRQRIDVVSSYWPLSPNPDEGLKFCNGINFLLMRDYGNAAQKHEFIFSPQFIRKLVSVKADRDLIMNVIVRRLTMTKAEAGRDGSLQEENLKGQTNIRRLRVTQRPTSKRIHIEIINSKIEFLMFYDEGEHDDGL